MSETPDGGPTSAGDGREVTVRYFASLRREAGREEEVVRTEAVTVAELYAELSGRHSLSQTTESLRAAVNHRTVPWDAAIEEGDVVAFLPPFAGG